MGVEIEHKYLVINDSYRQLATGKIEIKQGYLSRNPDRIVRIRTMGDKGFLTVKGRNKGDFRLEFEYEIPEADAKDIISLAEPGIVEKTRYIIPYDELIWEVDEFHGSLTGVIVAEVELPEQGLTYVKPPFIGKEITGDPNYYNSNMKV